MRSGRAAIAVLLAAMLTGVPAAAGPQADSEPPVAIYLLEDASTPAHLMTRQEVLDAPRQDEPLLTSCDVLFYDRATCRFYLDLETARNVAKRVADASGGGRIIEGWAGWSPRATTPPVVVEIGGGAPFAASLYRRDGLFEVHWPPESATRPPSGAIPNRYARGPRRRFREEGTTQPVSPPFLVLGRHFSEPAGFATLHLLDPWPDTGGGDPRGGEAFLAALRDAGKLDVSALAKPRMTPAEAEIAGRKTDMSFQAGDRRPTSWPVPDEWTCEAVAFCRDACVTVPSINILGFERVCWLHGVWLLRFEAPAEGATASTRPSGGSQQRPAWVRRMREYWCVVDDVTGRGVKIHPPLYARSLPVPGADEPALGPLATEQEVREEADEHLSRIDRVVFLESIEVLALNGRASKYRFWQPHRGVWLCEGIDGSGEKGRALVTDRMPRYKRPRVRFRPSGFEMRRAVPAESRSRAQP